MGVELTDNILLSPHSFRLATKPRSSLAFSLPESTLFSSVFLSPASASACKIGQGTLLTLTSMNNSMVVQAFISRELTGKSNVFCVPHSWPDMLDLSSLVTLAPLIEPVQHATQAHVKQFGSRKLDARLRTAIKHHLVGLVLPTSANLPIFCYGDRIDLQVAVKTECMDFSRNDLSQELLNLRISPERKQLPPNHTSTPMKVDPGFESCESNQSKGLFRLTVSTRIEFEEEEEKEVVNPRFLGGLSAEIKKLREALASVLHFSNQERESRRLLTGVLLFGPPGTGKTSLALSLPALLGVRMVTVAGPELYSKVYGETEAQLRAKFEEAREKAPAVIFIDELDSVAPRREAGASDQERRVSAALLTLLDRCG